MQNKINNSYFIEVNESAKNVLDYLNKSIK